MSQKIKVLIAGRHYPLTVGEGEEEMVRIAAKKVEELIKKIESSYSINDKQDALAMSAIQFATKFEIQNKMMNELFSSSFNKVEELNQIISSSLEN